VPVLCCMHAALTCRTRSAALMVVAVRLNNFLCVTTQLDICSFVCSATSHQAGGHQSIKLSFAPQATHMDHINTSISHACQAVSQQAISEEGRWCLQVPYAQVNQDGEEIDLNGAVLLPAISPYAEPWLLAGPTPVSPSSPPHPPPP